MLCFAVFFTIYTYYLAWDCPMTSHFVDINLYGVSPLPHTHAHTCTHTFTHIHTHIHKQHMHTHTHIYLPPLLWELGGFARVERCVSIAGVGQWTAADQSVLPLQSGLILHHDTGTAGAGNTRMETSPPNLQNFIMLWTVLIKHCIHRTELYTLTWC